MNRNFSFFKRMIFDALTFSFIFFAFWAIISQTTKDDFLNLEKYVLIELICLIVGGLLSLILKIVKIKTLGQLLFDNSNTNADMKHIPFYKSFWFWQILIVFIFLFYSGKTATQFSFKELLNIDGLKGAKNLFTALINPNFQILPKAIINIFETIFMSFIAMLIAAPIAFVFSFFAAKNIMKGKSLYLIYLLVRTFLNIIRSVETILWAIIFAVWVGIGPFAGMLALAIHSTASLAKQYSEIIESVNEGPIEAILSTGANKIQVIWFGIVPQVFLPFLAFTIYRWDINVRMATVVGFVGAGGIGTLLQQYQGQAMWNEVGTIILVITVVVWLMDQASAYLREALK